MHGARSSVDEAISAVTLGRMGWCRIVVLGEWVEILGSCRGQLSSDRHAARRAAVSCHHKYPNAPDRLLVAQAWSKR